MVSGCLHLSVQKSNANISKFIIYRTKPESVSLAEETKMMEERLEMVKRMMELEKEKRSVKMANSLDG